MNYRFRSIIDRLKKFILIKVKYLVQRQDKPKNSKNLWPLIIICLLIVFWQDTFAISASVLDDQYRQTAATGLRSNHFFFYFYYYLNLYPVYSTAMWPYDAGWQKLTDQSYIAPEYNKSGALSYFYSYPETLRTEVGHDIRSGSQGMTWMFFPEAWVKGSPENPSTIWFNKWFFIFGLISLLVASWYCDRFLLGILLVVFIGSHPFQLWEINNGWIFNKFVTDSSYSNGPGNIFSYVISVAVLALAFHLPLIFRKKVPGLYLWLLPVLFGFIYGTFRHVRTEITLTMISVAVCYLITTSINWRKRILLCIILLVSFLSTSSIWGIYFNNKINQAKDIVAKVGGYPLMEPVDQYHNLWHTIFCGLGDFDNKYGYKWNDQVARDYAFPILRSEGKLNFNQGDPDPSGKYYRIVWTVVPEYDVVLRQKVIHDIINDPIWYLKILAKRLLSILLNTVPLRLSFGGHWINIINKPFSGFLVIPTLLLLLLKRHWPYFFLLYFSLPLALLAFLVYSGGGDTYYSIFPQINAAIIICGAWSLIKDLWNKFLRSSKFNSFNEVL